MCGRYSLSSTKLTLKQRFELAQQSEFSPRYNLAPTQAGAVIRLAEDGSRSLKPMRWGLIPAWAKDASVGPKLINARAETLAGLIEYMKGHDGVWFATMAEIAQIAANIFLTGMPM